MSNDLTLPQFLHDHLAVVEPLLRDAQLADWELQTTGSEEAKANFAGRLARVAKIYANPQEYAFLQRVPAESLADPLLARQRDVLLREYLSNRMDEPVIAEIIGLEVEIESVFNTHRAVLRGKSVSNNEIEEIMVGSEDADLRREAWAASKTVGARVAEDVRRLVRLRNREARRLGFENYYAMSLTLQELDETRLFALLDELQTASDSLWQTYRAALDARLAARFQTTPDRIRPWHHANLYFQEPGPGEANLDGFFADKNLESLAADFFAAVGLPINDLLQNADLYERPGKSQHAFCTDIDRRGDIRVLCNLRPNERWMCTLLHEFGHAVYDKFYDPALPYLLRCPAHTLTTEAVALFMGRLTKDAHWLHRYAGAPAEEAARIAADAQREMRDGLLVFMRWCLVMTHFERALYRDPDQDLDMLWWNLVEKFQKIVCPREDRPPHTWAAKIHLATAPVYYQNYQLGDMVASQALHHIRTVVLAGEPPEALVTSPKVGAYLMDKLFAPGTTRPWESWLEYATGEPLNPRYFVQQLQNI